MAITALCWPQLLRQLYAFDNKTFAFFSLCIPGRGRLALCLPLTLSLSLALYSYYDYMVFMLWRIFIVKYATRLLCPA